MQPKIFNRFSPAASNPSRWISTLRFRPRLLRRYLTSLEIRHQSTMASSKQAIGAWVGGQGAGSFDLRSDVVTVPTPSMLAAMTSCSLRDDVFNEDDTTSSLEAHVAQLAGKEAGLFVPSGTMGNHIALRSLLTQPPFAVLADHRSHIILYEAGGVSSLTGATIKPVVPRNGIHLTLEDVAANVVLDDGDVHACPTRVISLENTLNGIIMPLSEVSRIGEFARRHNIRMHCDGARLWEAAVAVASSSSSDTETDASPDRLLAAFCRPFDTVSLCLSKGLGAPVGSVLVGGRATLAHARRVRKSIGGGMRQPGFIAAAARVAVDETFGARGGARLRASHDMARRVEALWTRMGGGPLLYPVHTNMCWVDIEACGGDSGSGSGGLSAAKAFAAVCAEHGLVVAGGRLVTHYQVAEKGDEVLRRLEKVFEKVLRGAEK